ncbi:MAG: hypothetical protein ACTHMO_05535 [Rhodanobacteraceae bacterium]
MSFAGVNDRIQPFTSGWALIPFGQRAHLWRPMGHQDELRSKLNAGADVTFYEAACGHHAAATKRTPPLPNLSSDFPKCKHCARIEAGA